MTGSESWRDDALDRIGTAVEIEIGTTRPNGSPRPWVPIWVVRVGGQVYVRSWTADRGGWYRAARGQGRARIRVGPDEWPVIVTVASTDGGDAINLAYQRKYGRHGSGSVRPMVTAQAAATTLRLSPGAESATGPGSAHPG